MLYLSCLAGPLSQPLTEVPPFSAQPQPRTDLKRVCAKGMSEVTAETITRFAPADAVKAENFTLFRGNKELLKDTKLTIAKTVAEFNSVGGKVTVMFSRIFLKIWMS